MAGRHPTPAAERFKEKCRPAENGCIEWTAGGTAKGYGLFHYGNRMHIAHRWAYEQAYGKQPSGIDVCHHCDNRRCVNLAHLFVGTRRDNMQDARAKGRLNLTVKARGEDHGRAVLTAEQATEIRRLYPQGWTLRLLAESFAVSIPTIHRVVTNRTYGESNAST